MASMSLLCKIQELQRVIEQQGVCQLSTAACANLWEHLGTIFCFVVPPFVVEVQVCLLQVVSSAL